MDETDKSKTMPVEYCHVETLVENVRRAFELVDQAYQRLNDAQEILTKLPGWDLSRVGVLYSHHHSTNDSMSGDKTEVTKVRRAIAASAWLAIGEKLRLRDIMTEHQYNEWHRNVETTTLPDVTISNVWATMQGLVARFPEFATRVIDEAYNACRPRPRGYKTNDRFAVGRKVILTHVMQTKYAGVVEVAYHSQHKLRDLATAMRLLDGKGIPKSFWGDIVDAVNATNESSRGRYMCADTEYFSLRWYRNGHLHVTFKRQDLLDKWNRKVGAGQLHCGEDSTHGTTEANAAYRHASEQENADAPGPEACPEEDRPVERSTETAVTQTTMEALSCRA